MTLLEHLDITFGFCHERKSGKGEDSWGYAFHEAAGFMGVFDGCGGAGAQVYERMQGHTGAYLASRTVCDAFRNWFRCYSTGNAQLGDGTLEKMIQEELQIAGGFEGQSTSRIRSKLMRKLPTTAAVWLTVPDDKQVYAVSISAGDSRTYLLDYSGLKQISKDDLRGEDAMSDIYNSAPMTNMISAEQPVSLHYAPLRLENPCILLSATDGCFGYLGSPMEFEYLLLDTMMTSQNAVQWQKKLEHAVEEVAGDDQSMAVAAFDYGSFAGMQRAMAERHAALSAMIEAFGDENQRRWDAWEAYKQEYYSMAVGGVPEVEQ